MMKYKELKYYVLPSLIMTMLWFAGQIAFSDFKNQLRAEGYIMAVYDSVKSPLRFHEFQIEVIK